MRVPARGDAARGALSAVEHRRWLIGLAVAVCVVVAQVHLLGPPWSDTAHQLTRGASVLVAWAGVFRIPAYRWTAAGVAGGYTLVAVGEVSTGLLAGLTVAGMALTDVVFLLAYVSLWLGLRLLLPGGRRSRAARLDGLIDAAAVFVVMTYVEWELALAILGPDDLSLSSDTIWVLFPFLDAALIAVTVRIWASRRRGNAGIVLVGAALFCWFLADLVFLIAGDSPAAGAWVTAGWLTAGLCFAVATWTRPRRVLSVSRESERPLTVWRIGLALAPVLVPAVVEVIAHSLGTHGDPLPGVIATAVLLLLAFVRTTRLLLDQRALRAGLRSQARYFSALAANSSDAVVVLDRQGRLHHDSPELARLLGRDEAVPAGSELISRAVPEAKALFTRVLSEQGQVLSAEMRSQVGGDRQRWFGVRMVNLMDDPDVGGVVVTLQDVTDRVLVQEEIAHNALHDGLTGLANRALFDDRLEQALRRATRSGVWPVILYIDLDRFKAVNDTHGHGLGDLLLRAAAVRLQDAVRAGDTVARLGGDEFAVLMEQGRCPGEEAEAAATRVLSALGDPFVLAGQHVRLSASVGLAIGNEGATASTLLRDADIAMYAAKAAGKSRFVRFDADMRASALERAQLETDLDEALERGQFRLAYQPVIELATRRIVGFEALLRWDHPVLGEVPPAAFVPVAENAGRMTELGGWVLAQACATAARWQREHPAAGALTMAVNVSGSQLGDAGFTGLVSEVLESCGLPPGDLVLELTETALVRDPHQAAVYLQTLRDLGVRLAIDDFGTGYSSLSYLRQFPVDILKIDRSFVSMISEDEPVPPILRGLMELARTVGLDLVAEGVETEGQHERLQAERCHLAQGHLYAAALDEAAAEREVLALSDRHAEMLGG